MADFSRREILKSGTIVSASMLSSPIGAAGSVSGENGLPRLGVCYYPEHWAQEQWPVDAASMRKRGISRVRIGEFAWTLMEPERGRFDWAWLDKVIDILGKEGLGVILGTPTATPPAWLVAELPEILPVGADGDVKGFGSRRYYTFSSACYREEATRIARAMASRYGRHPAVVGWQIDNEYGCHDTTFSYGPLDKKGFQDWLSKKYGTVQRLNQAWGAVVWSQQVDGFADVGLPFATPYDPAPCKLLDYRRYATDQVASFNQAQVDAIRPLSPGRFVTTNFMTNFTEFDHYQVGDALDFASWDSYPLGVAAGRNEPQWDHTGNPDIAPFNHDLMRAINPAPFWIMEQQPGPVNWARYNPVPAAGMVRLWTWEAFAHGAATVSYFRWRQGQIGQEQMHAGLNMPDGRISVGGREAEQVAQEIAALGRLPSTVQAPVALVFDYETVWMTAIQPNGAGQDHLADVQAWYAGLRTLGLDVDIVRPSADLRGYRLVVIPSLRVVRPEVIKNLQNFLGHLVIGPRTASKTEDFAVPENLPPGPLQALIPVKVQQVETLRETEKWQVAGANIEGGAVRWRETLETSLPALARYDNGEPAVVGKGRMWYVGCCGNEQFTQSLMKAAALGAGLSIVELPPSIRMRCRGNMRFIFNYGSQPWTAAVGKGRFLLGESQVAPHSLSVQLLDDTV